jgi:WD40 repeat protein
MGPSPVKFPAIENLPLESKSQSDDDQRGSRKSLNLNPKESKIPRIKLPKMTSNSENRQSTSRSAKAHPPVTSGERLPSARRVNAVPKVLDEVQLEGVMYPQCRSAVSASQQDIDCLKALNDPMDYKLKPFHCFGYNGDTSRSNYTIANKNLFWLNSTHLIYPAASLVVVLNMSLNSQSFFCGHSEHVTCISVNQTNRVVASCQTGTDTKVRIWDYSPLLQGKSSSICSKLGISSSIKAIGGLNFSGDGKYLLVYASEDVRSIFVLDWTKNNVLCCVKSGHPDNCEVFFDPYSYLPFIEDDVSNLSPSQAYLPGCYNIISRSGRQLKVWTMKSCLATEPTKSLLKNNKHMQAIEYVLESGSLHQGNKQVEYTSVICTSTFEASSYIFAGISSGAIQIWAQLKEDTTDEQYGSTWIARGRLLMVIEKAHDSPILNFDFLITATSCKVATCDRDGVVNIWNMNTSTEVCKEDMLSHADAVHIEDVGVRTILWSENGDQLVAGTLSNNILAMSWPANIRAESSGSSVQFDFIVRSHTNKVRKAAVNPLRNNFVATIGNDKMIKLWSIIAKQFLCHLSLEVVPTTVQFSANGHFIIVGNEQGEMIVLKSTTFSSILNSGHIPSSAISIADWEVVQSKEFTTAADKKQQKKNGITAISCSSNGLHLAVGCKDGSIHILSVESNYRRVGVCKGHTSQVKNIDFSSDGRFIKSTDSSRYLLHWEVATGGRFNNIALIRTLEWESFTCLYGWGLQGVFNTSVEGQTEQDVNCIAKMVDSRFVLAASGHSSIIKKFRYPCLSDAIPEAIYGHSAPVLDMIANSLNQLITVGGQDCVVIVWEIAANGI